MLRPARLVVAAYGHGETMTRHEDSFQIRGAVASDLPRVAQLHVQCFPESVFPRLGADVVERHYEWLMNGPHRSVVLVYETDGDAIVGAAVGGTFNGAVTGFLRQDPLFLMRAAALHPSVFIHRDRLSKARHGLRLAARSFRPSSQPSAIGPTQLHLQEEKQSFGLLSLAVDPRYRRSGVGSALTETCEARARSLGYTHLHTTMRTDNLAMIKLQEAHGMARELDEEGRWAGRMSKKL